MLHSLQYLSSFHFYIFDFKNDTQLKSENYISSCEEDEIIGTCWVVFLFHFTCIAPVDVPSSERVHRKNIKWTCQHAFSIVRRFTSTFVSGHRGHSVSRSALFKTGFDSPSWDGFDQFLPMRFLPTTIALDFNGILLLLSAFFGIRFIVFTYR